MNFLNKRICLAIAMFSFVSLTHANTIDTVLPESNTLTWTDLRTSPGAKYAILAGNPEKKGYFVVRVKFPADYSVAPHQHIIDEYDTVISGTYYLGTGNTLDTKNATALTAGSFAKIPAKINHYGWTKEETILQISGMGPWGVIYHKSSELPS